MEKQEYPLIVEYHDGFQDVYVWKGLPGGFSRLDLYFISGLTLVVFVALFIQGLRDLQGYIGALLLLIILSGLYKGIKVGLDSIKYKRYEDGKITRLADTFLIWGRDKPLEIEENMTVVIRPVTSTQDGVVYLYSGNDREIVFLASKDIYLDQFAGILSEKYNLQIGENVYD